MVLRRLIFGIVAIGAILLAGCGNEPARPANVPETASHWTSVKQTMWMACNPSGSLMECEIWQTRGTKYEQGQYRLAKDDTGCSVPAYSTRYRYGEGFLRPVDAISSDGRVAYGSIKDEEPLEEAINRVFFNRFGDDLTDFEYFTNGVSDTFSATTKVGRLTVGGRTMCGAVFTVFRPSDG